MIRWYDYIIIFFYADVAAAALLTFDMRVYAVLLPFYLLGWFAYEWGRKGMEDFYNG